MLAAMKSCSGYKVTAHHPCIGTAGYTWEEQELVQQDWEGRCEGLVDTVGEGRIFQLFGGEKRQRRHQHVSIAGPQGDVAQHTQGMWWVSGQALSSESHNAPPRPQGFLHIQDGIHDVCLDVLDTQLVHQACPLHDVQDL